jgi:hypothetical protein
MSNLQNLVPLADLFKTTVVGDESLLAEHADGAITMGQSGQLRISAAHTVGSVFKIVVTRAGVAAADITLGTLAANVGQRLHWDVAQGDVIEFECATGGVLTMIVSLVKGGIA